MSQIRASFDVEKLYPLYGHFNKFPFVAEYVLSYNKVVCLQHSHTSIYGNLPGNYFHWIGLISFKIWHKRESKSDILVFAAYWRELFEQGEKSFRVTV